MNTFLTNLGFLLFYLCFFALLFMVACGIEWLLEQLEKRNEIYYRKKLRRIRKE